MKRFILLFIALVLLVLSHSVSADHLNDSEINAVWQTHNERFTLTSFYNYYSCDGVESKVEVLLKELGAKDVKARARGCYDLNGNLGKHLRVQVELAVSARLQKVHIRPRHPRSVGLGDCELIDDMQRTLLDKFEHEVIKKNRKCFPGSQSLGDVNWQLNVLKTIS